MNPTQLGGSGKWKGLKESQSDGQYKIQIYLVARGNSVKRNIWQDCFWTTTLATKKPKWVQRKMTLECWLAEKPSLTRKTFAEDVLICLWCAFNGGRTYHTRKKRDVFHNFVNFYNGKGHLWLICWMLGGKFCSGIGKVWEKLDLHQRYQRRFS